MGHSPCCVGGILAPNLPDLLLRKLFPPTAPPPTKGLALGGWALAPLSVFILFAYLHINLTEFFEGKDHGSFISIFGPRGLKKKKKKLCKMNSCYGRAEVVWGSFPKDGEL